MSDYLPMMGLSKNIAMSCKRLNSCLATSSPYSTSKKPFHPIKNLEMKGLSGRVFRFLLNVAVLDVVRTLSRRKCRMAWYILQSLQILNFPPFKWIQRWGPFKSLVKGMQALSKPLLFLSVVRTFSDNSQRSKKVLHNAITNPPYSEPPTNGTFSDSRTTGEPSECVASNNCLIQLREELKSQGLVLPERFNDDELERFFIASDANVACLQQSLKRTIHWRETYRILSPEELETWSNLLFWHGTDVKLRPCLIIRLGLGCSSSMFRNRLSIVDALVSQIEYGVQNLLNKEDPTVTVLVDCEGLTPLRFPMKMLRSCVKLMQEHYPNRLATLLVIRLPPVVRVLAQTFLQVLGPKTRQKLHVGGDAYQKLLSEFLLSVPSFLGGQCTCCMCVDTFPRKVNQELGQHSQIEHVKDISDDGQQEAAPCLSRSLPYGGNFDPVLGNTVISVLLIWIVLVVLMGIHGAGRLSVLNS